MPTINFTPEEIEQLHLRSLSPSPSESTEKDGSGLSEGWCSRSVVDEVGVQVEQVGSEVEPQICNTTTLVNAGISNHWHWFLECVAPADLASAS